MVQRKKILFLCTGNSARSQMAEAFLRHYASDSYEAYSAGLEPKGIHPFTVRVMNEAGIDIAGQTSTDLRLFLGAVHFHTLVTVCSNADRNCPTVWPGVQRRLHWGFEDPAAAQGSEEERLEVFRRVRDEIRQKILDWVLEENLQA